MKLERVKRWFAEMVEIKLHLRIYELFVILMVVSGSAGLVCAGMWGLGVFGMSMAWMAAWILGRS